MRVVEVDVPPADAELATDRLWSAGATAIEERDVGGRLVYRTILATDDDVSLARLGPLPDAWTVRFVDEPDAPSEAWRDFAETIVVNDELEIRPAWLAGGDGSGRVVVAIEPAGSFGLGDHPTTRLSAGAVWDVVRSGDEVLDVGCGSGVLSIVALQRGARRAVAIDVAEAAREATVQNARSNGVADRVDASCRPLADIDGTFDVVVANILAPTLVELADDLCRTLAAEGTLIISGILAGRHDHVLAALGPLRVIETVECDGWAAVTLRR